MQTQPNAILLQVKSVAWTIRKPDSRELIAVGQADGRIRLIDAETLEEVMECNGDNVNALVFSPDGARIAVSTSRNTVDVWDTRSGHMISRIKGHARMVNSLDFVGNNERLWTAGEDGALKSWDVSQAEPFQRFRFPDPQLNRAVQFAANGHSLWHFSSRELMKRVHVDTGQSLENFPENKQAKQDDNAEARDKGVGRSPDEESSFSANGQYIARFSDNSNQIEIWTTASATPIRKETRDLPKEIDFDKPYRITVSNNGKVVAFCGVNTDVHIMQMDDGRHIRFDRGLEKAMRNLYLSPDGSTLLIPQFHSSILYDVSGKDPKRIKEIGGEGPIFQSEFSPDGKYFAQAHWNNEVRLFDATNGSLLKKYLGHGGTVRAVAFSPNGKLLASGGQDGTVRLWDLDPKNRDLLLTLSGHGDEVRSLSFSPDNLMIASASIDGDIRIWKSMSEDEVLQDETFWHTRRTFHLQRGEWEAALESQSQVIQLTPENSHSYKTRAHINLAREKVSDAIADFQSAGERGDVHYVGQLEPFLTCQPVDAPEQPKQWKYTLETPDPVWSSAGYDDSKWQSSTISFFGGDIWQENIWLRREFTFDSDASESISFLVFSIHDTTIYLNGELAGKAGKDVLWYQFVESKVACRRGQNMLAVHCQNTSSSPAVHVIPVRKTQGKNLVAILSEIIPRNPNDESAFQRRAELYSRLKNWDNAARDYLSSLDIRSRALTWKNGPDWHSDRAQYLKNLAGQDELFTAFRRQKPDKEDLWLARGRALALQCKWADAEQAFANYNEKIDSQSDIWLEIACVQLLNENKPKYQKLLAKMLEQKTDSNDPIFSYLKSRVVSLSAQSPELSKQSVDWAKFALEHHDENWFLQSLGFAFFRNGQYEQAKSSLNKAIQNGYLVELNQLVLALIAIEEGDNESAQKFLAFAQEWKERQHRVNITPEFRRRTLAWIFFHVFLKDAETRIAPE